MSYAIFQDKIRKKNSKYVYIHDTNTQHIFGWHFNYFFRGPVITSHHMPSIKLAL